MVKSVFKSVFHQLNVQFKSVFADLAGKWEVGSGKWEVGGLYFPE
ncbi:MAG: hypothetical protein P8O16_00180 [Algoriphagus sp.]|nr:hypothetical protein [Algoriphagus sp.]MDG1275663.1 hypothetical protein [Algoriphagus sp.]